MFFRSFVSETTWVGSGFSDGSRLETRDISGSCWEPCWNHGVDAAGSAMLRLWHGLGLLQMVGFKARVQRTGFQVNLARVGGRIARAGREFRSTRERERERGRVVLNSPIWTPPTGG